MADFYPSYIIYANDNATPIYDIEYVQEDNSPQDPKSYIEHLGLRGTGSVIADGCDESWDLRLNFILISDNYEDLIAKMDTMESTIVKNTEYYIKIGRTISTTRDYKIKRTLPIQWDKSRRTNTQKGVLILKINSW